MDLHSASPSTRADRFPVKHIKPPFPPLQIGLRNLLASRSPVSPFSLLTILTAQLSPESWHPAVRPTTALSHYKHTLEQESYIAHKNIFKTHNKLFSCSVTELPQTGTEHCTSQFKTISREEGYTGLSLEYHHHSWNYSS